MRAPLVGLTLSLFASTAFAADAVVDEVVLVDEPFDWSGTYIGANVGYGRTDVEYGSYFVGFDDGDISDDFAGGADGILGGAQVGFNVQMNRFVLGVEADLQATDLSENVHRHYVPFGAADLDANLGFDINWVSTVRGRLGIAAANRLLIYGTAGIAVGEVESHFSYDSVPRVPLGSPTSAADSSKDTRTGWAAGAGAEYAVTDNWSLKAEYLYVDLGDEADVPFAVPSYPQREISGDLTADCSLGRELQILDSSVGYFVCGGRDFGPVAQ